MAKAKTTTAAKPKPKTKPAEREVVHHEVTAVLLDGKGGNDLLDADEAKRLLGWQTEEQAGEKFGEGDYLIKDRSHKKVRMTNNVINRPLYQSNVMGLMQEQLEGRWVLNGETIIITKTDQVGNGQHQLTALVLAQEEIEADPDKWKEKWPEGIIRIPKLIVKGIDDSSLDTMDNGKPRTLGDVLFRSENLQKIKPHLRRSLALVLAFAIRSMWERTGMMRYTQAFDPRKRTYGEMLDFLSRHPKLVDAVHHVWQNDEKGKLSKYLKAGTAGAFMYMMACSESDPDGYAKNRRESKLKFTHWKKAETFFTLLRDQPELKPIRDAIDNRADPDTGESKITPQEKMAIVIRGWQAFLANDRVKKSDLELNYRTDDDGTTYLAEFPTIGGIDLGPRVNQADDDEAPEDADSEDVEAQNRADAEAEAEADEEMVAMGSDDYSAGDEEMVDMEVEERKAKEGPKPEKTFKAPKNPPKTSKEKETPAPKKPKKAKAGK